MKIFEDEAVEPFLELIRDVERRSRVTQSVEGVLGAAEQPAGAADGIDDTDDNEEPMAQD